MDLTSLGQALQLSQKMLQLAEASDWEPLDGLDAERRQLLEAGLAGEVSETERPEARAILQQIQGLNDRTLARVSQGKVALYESMQLFRHRQDAASAYVACEQDSFSDEG